MIIHNIRLGFATNSSSSHSLIFLKDAYDSLEGFEFGWDQFVAASQNAKKVYLANTISDALREHVDRKTASLITTQLVGCSDKGHIDHQSIYTLPYNWDGNGLDYDFIKEFSEFLLQENLVILGGNDNEDARHPLDNGQAFILSLAQDGQSKNWIAKKDPQGFWTLFNKSTGAKVRLSFPIINELSAERFERVAGAIHPDYATTPDLIDIKITDFCDRGCSYCYQNSTPQGKHAEIQNSMWAICDALARMKVFEVAIGGGEPTKHPYFIKFLKELKRVGITPNFSTRDLSWIKDPTTRKDILNNIGSFAYSVDNANDVDLLASYIDVFCDNRTKRPSIHCVMGMSSYTFKSVLDAALYHNFDVVLLDYKEIGRACQHSRSVYNGWIEEIVERKENHKCPNISIDTPLAEKFADELRGAGVKDLFVQTVEGKFSMYLDLVGGQIGPSSFCSPEEMLPIDISACSNSLYEQINTGFRTF